ncbi:flavodoxin [Lederbergia lenta]|uniref:flavodoxin n=1 Tax=Lederbergia lenta TaxID=1467 RepID=UPI00203E120C|nr:flavodoxin [Lederbergia lenta]MCM3111027.1 flavodoxin [Lederbergia lenta]
MRKILLIYTSATGNTEMMAEAIIAVIKNNRLQLSIKDAFDVEPEELLHYDGILIGTYTWDGGVIPDEFMDFYEELDALNLKGIKAATFGSGDSYYTSTYGSAIHLFANKLEELGADIALDSLIIDLQPDDDGIKACNNFAEHFIKTLVAQ